MSTQVTISDFSTGGSISTDDVAQKEQARVTEAGQRSHETSSEIWINQEEIIPVFAEVRTKLLPVIKLYSWLKTTKDLLQQLNTGPQSVLFQPINRACPVNFGVTVAIVREQEQCHYVLNSYLAEWHISQSTLIQIAQANLRRRLIEGGENIWHKSATGIRFVQGLGPLTASVILLPDVIEQLGSEHGDAVVVIPTNDLCMIGGSKNVKQLCVMGEISLRYAKQQSFLSAQPLRLLDKKWRLFEANKANDEHSFPRSPDEVKMLKRALKMQGEI